MRLRLPYVFELDCEHHGGRSVRAENYWSEIEVEVPEVDALGDPVVKDPVEKCHLWNGRLFDRWSMYTPDREFLGPQESIDAVRTGRRVSCPWTPFPTPPYMRVRRMGFIESALTLNCPRFEHVPYSARRVCRNGMDQRAEEARAFYGQTLLICGGKLWVAAENTVLLVKRSKSKRDEYAIVQQPRPDFRNAYREFRIDRLDDARAFIHEALRSTFYPLEPLLEIRDPALLTSSDERLLSACVIECLPKPDDEDRYIPGLFSDDPRDATPGIAEAHLRMASAMSEGNQIKSLKLQMLAQRWEFEKPIWARKKLEEAEILDPELQRLQDEAVKELGMFSLI